MNLRNQLEQRISQALTAAGAPEGAAALVGPSAKPEFGDYQANGVMAAAKALKTKPRDLTWPPSGVAPAGLASPRSSGVTERPR